MEKKIQPTIMLVEHAKAQGAVKMAKVLGPNGAFISLEKADGSKFTMPVGKRSQEGKLADYKVLITNDGVAIATVNNYSTEEEIAL